MSRRPSVFTQADIARAIKGVRDGGESVAQIEIAKDGTIRLFTMPVEKEIETYPEPRL